MKWIAVCFVLAGLLAGANAGEKPDLTGKVMDPNGKAIKDASVFIYTAGPRVGPGYI